MSMILFAGVLCWLITLALLLWYNNKYYQEQFENDEE